MRPLSQVTNAEIKAAEVIEATDPNDHEWSLQAWGQESVPPSVPAGAAAHEINVLRITIHSEDEVAVQSLLRRVKAVKGRLPKDIEHLLST